MTGIWASCPCSCNSSVLFSSSHTQCLLWDGVRSDAFSHSFPRLAKGW